MTAGKKHILEKQSGLTKKVYFLKHRLVVTFRNSFAEKLGSWETFLINRKPAYNFSYPSSAAAVVFSGHLSAQAAFRLDRKSPAIRPCV